jgi:hypothetical protein
VADTFSVPGTGIKGIRKGGLHETVGVPEGQPIPASKKAAALAGKYGSKGVKQAQLAETLGGFKHKKKSRASNLARMAAGK